MAKYEEMKSKNKNEEIGIIRKEITTRSKAI
jgi:hypothetical protein